MGLFDNNIHMNGAGTTYQSFLDLADEAEQKGGKIGERTVRLVKAGDGLATTTFHGTTGARNLDADAREKLFDAAGNAATAKSAEIQKLSEAGGNDNQALRMEAKHWSSASSCIMQLRQGA